MVGWVKLCFLLIVTEIIFAHSWNQFYKGDSRNDIKSWEVKDVWTSFKCMGCAFPFSQCEPQPKHIAIMAGIFLVLSRTLFYSAVLFPCLKRGYIKMLPSVKLNLRCFVEWI